MRRELGILGEELLVVIAIVGILAALSNDRFIEMQLAAKRAERPASLATLGAAEEEYYEDNGEYSENVEQLADEGYVDEEYVDSVQNSNDFNLSYSGSSDSFSATAEPKENDDDNSVNSLKMKASKKRVKGLYYKINQSGVMKVKANKPAKRKAASLSKYFRKCTREIFTYKKKKRRKIKRKLSFRCGLEQKNSRSQAARTWEALMRVNKMVYDDVDGKHWTSPRSFNNSSLNLDTNGFNDLHAFITREILFALDAADGTSDSRIEYSALAELSADEFLQIARNVVTIVNLGGGNDIGQGPQWLEQMLTQFRTILLIGQGDALENRVVELPDDLYSENDDVLNALHNTVLAGPGW